VFDERDADQQGTDAEHEDRTKGGGVGHAGSGAYEARIPTRRMRHSVRAESSGAARPLIFLLRAMRRAASPRRRAPRRRPAGSDGAQPNRECFLVPTRQACRAC
jgi:hypothetical protein